MTANFASDPLDLAESILDWWQLAGVSDGYADATVDWFAAPEVATAPVVSVTKPLPVTATAPEVKRGRPAPQYLPEWKKPLTAPPADHAAFLVWWGSDPQLALPSGTGSRIAPHGILDSDLMVIADMPDPDDRDRLFTSTSGTLLTRIIRASGFAPDRCYFASILPEHSIGGAVPPDQRGYYASVMRHHIGLVRPKRLALLGDFTNSALTSHDLAHNQRQLRFVNQDDGNILATASFHPRLLLQNPGLKRQAWADWQRIMGNPLC